MIALASSRTLDAAAPAVEGLPTNRPQSGSAQLGQARKRKHGLVELPEFKQQGAELFAGRLVLAQIVR